MTFTGYQRPNGDIGIRNKILLVAVDECCEGVVRSIAKTCADAVVMTNWLTCMLGGHAEGSVFSVRDFFCIFCRTLSGQQ